MAHPSLTARSWLPLLLLAVAVLAQAAAVQHGASVIEGGTFGDEALDGAAAGAQNGGAAAAADGSLSSSVGSLSDEVSASDSLSLRTESVSDSDNVTISDSAGSRSPTESLTVSAVVPPEPAEVALLSAVVIDSACIATDQESSEFIRCRTIRFEMRNDGFLYQSPRTTYEVRTFLMQPSDLSDAEPFGLVAQWDTLGLQASVLTNVSHLVIDLPTNPGLTLNAPAVITMNFTSAYTLRRQEPAAPTQFDIAVSPTPKPAPDSTALAFQTAAGILSLLTLGMPVDMGILDVQSSVIVSSSVCTQAEARVIGLEGRRLLFPTIDPDDPIENGLGHSLIMCAAFALLHILVVYAVKQRYGCDFWPAAARALFPALTLAAGAFLQPGVASASLTLLFTAYASPLLRMACILTSAAAVLAVVLPITSLARFAKEAESRNHYDILFEFPIVVRFMLPTISWGPEVKRAMWTVPFGCVKPKRVKWATLHLAQVTALALIFAVPPGTPGGCAAQLFFGMATIIVQLVILGLRRPFRSSFHNVSSMATSGALLLPMLLSFIHCFRLTDNTGLGVAALFTLCHALTMVRVVLACISHLLDHLFLRPAVWPDWMAGMVMARRLPGTGESPLAAPIKKNNKNGRGNSSDDDDDDGSDGEAAPGREVGADFDAVQGGDYDPLQDQELMDIVRRVEGYDVRAVEEEREREELRCIPPEERATRLAFGPPDPLPARVLPQHGGAQSHAGIHRTQVELEHRRAVMGEPLANVHRMRGPIPPGLKDRLSLEYDRL